MKNIQINNQILIKRQSYSLKPNFLCTSFLKQKRNYKNIEWHSFYGQQFKNVKQKERNTTHKKD